MERREFLGKAAAGAALAGWSAACGGPAEKTGRATSELPRLQWRLASSFPRALDTIYGAAEEVARRVEALTKGRFRIRSHPAGELVPGLQVFDAVQSGTVQLGHTASYYFIGKHPAFAFDCAVPFGLTARQHNAWVYYGGGREALAPLFADFNIVALPCGSTGMQMGGWFRQELGSVADLEGLKMRIPGLGGEVMSRLGVTVQLISGGEIYPALERGAIDATEWVGPYDDEKLGFYKVARYYYYPGWWEPGPSLSLYVNKEAWEALPAAYQAALEAAAAEANVRMLAHYDALNPPALDRLVAAGVELRPFPPDLLAAAEKEAEALLREKAAADEVYRRIFKSWAAWRTKVRRWFGTAERAYGAYLYGRDRGA